MAPIVDLSITSHTTRSAPSAHVVYAIAVTTPTHAYTIHRRHRQFVALDAALRSSCALPPPSPFPDTSRSHASLYGWLDDEFLHTRRRALQKYLRAIALGGGRHAAVWTESDAWKEFIGKGDGAPAGQADALAAPVSRAKGIPFKGANSYYLWALNDPDRTEVLDALVTGGITVVRIFIAHVNANNKGSNNPDVNDLEPVALGTYDDTILEKIDQLMLDCSTRGIKLIIACHDRYALGFWDTDQYALTYGIVSPGTSGAQQIVNAKVFYTSNPCMTFFDHRIDHILAHENSLMGNVVWGANPGGVIYAFEPENESMGHMASIPSTSWLNDRGGRIKQNLTTTSGILTTNGGGIDIASSTTSAMLNMANIDVVCVHDYSTDVWDTMPTVSTARGTAEANGKQLIFEEWGAVGSGKSSTIYSWVEALYDYDLAGMIWEVVKPGAGNNDYEIWTTDADGAWASLIHTPTGN